jgi:hypothetical protein
MAESKSLKTAVKKAVGKAQKDAKTGDVETVPETKGGPTTDAPKDLPTGARSHP